MLIKKHNHANVKHNNFLTTKQEICNNVKVIFGEVNNLYVNVS